MIFKVQRPLYSTDEGMAKALMIYNEAWSVMFWSKDQKLYEIMGDRLKIYVEAELVQDDPPRLGDPILIVEEQDW